MIFQVNDSLALVKLCKETVNNALLEVMFLCIILFVLALSIVDYYSKFESQDETFCRLFSGWGGEMKCIIHSYYLCISELLQLLTLLF